MRANLASKCRLSTCDLHKLQGHISSSQRRFSRIKEHKSPIASRRLICRPSGPLTITASYSSGEESRSRGSIGAYAPGTLLDKRYQVQSLIGSGGNGVTYRCSDIESTGNDVAVKVLSLKNLKDWKQLELFEREAQILRNLNHPAIPKYIDYFEVDTDVDKAFFIVQELADGVSLQEMIGRGWRPTESEITRIATQLLEILIYLGSLRPPVVHRDIKPSNIVLQGGEAGGKVYLVDFGGVQATSANADSLGSTIVGTYGFMAPEQFRGSAIPASDAYALGGTILYLLSGKPPSAFPVDRLRLNLDSVEMGPKLRALCEGLLEPAVEDRINANQALELLSGRAPARSTAVVGGSTFRRPSGFTPAVQSDRAGPITKPVGSRVNVTKRGSSLYIDIPPAKFSGNTAFTGAFAIAWNTFVGFWTVGALAGGGVLFALFSLPFWFAGANLLKTAFAPQLIRERLEINLKSWKLSKELALFKDGAVDWSSKPGSSGMKAAKGRSSDLSGAGYQILAYVNGQPQGSLVLKQGVETYNVGEGLDPVEQEWLAEVINKHLDENREAMLDMSATKEDTGVLAPSPSGEFDPFTERDFEKFDSKLGAVPEKQDGGSKGPRSSSSSGSVGTIDVDDFEVMAED